MIGGILASLAGLIAQSQATASQNNIANQNLTFQKDMFERQDELATAPRTDAYGNETGFDDALNKWYTTLTPSQRRLLGAGEREQILSLTEDAPRERALRERQDERSKGAGDVYSDLLADFQYDEPPDEETIRAEIARSMAGARTAGSNRAKNVIGGQALRLGRGGDIPAIMKAATSGLSEEDSLNARQAALAEVGTRDQQHRGRTLDPMMRFGQIMDDVGDAPQHFGNVAEKADERQSGMLAAITRAIEGGASRIGSAYGQLSDTIKPLDFSSLASSLNSLKLGGGGTSKGIVPASGGAYYPKSEYETAYDDRYRDEPSNYGLF